MSKNLTAIVKSVISGDTLLLVHPTKNVEKQLSLSYIQAPKLSRSKDSIDEPFAFSAREFVRKKCIGKLVEFKVEFTNKKEGKPRDYGTVLVPKDDNENEKEDLIEEIVKNGFAKVKEIKSLEEELKKLVELQEEAKKRKLNIWCENDAIKKKYKSS
eukprot:EC823691.1.p1 GENE.EC823691.1~~EC823691.1.p1  ORF type:complete len:157 (+),score=80.47 EC823691.1:55-525(+)